MRWIVFALFIVVPIAELAVIIQVGNLIGPLWTIALLFGSAILGSWLLRREGQRTWRAFQEALAEQRLPTREVADGALVLLGAALMITPGFVTDFAGVLCLFSPSRGLLRRMLLGAVTYRVLRRGGIVSGSRVRPPRSPGGSVQQPRVGPPTESRVIEGEVEP